MSTPPSPRATWGLTIAATYFFALGAAFAWTYLPRYFTTIGWSTTAVGLLLGFATLVRVTAMPTWARIAERVGSTRRVVRAVTTTGAVLLWLLPLVDATWAVFLLVAAIFGTTNAMMPLIDALTVRQLGSTRFGRARAAGSVGFGVTAAAVAWVGADQPHEVVAGWAPWLAAALATCSAVATWLYPANEVATATPSLKDAWRIVRRPALLWCLPIWMVHWASQAPYNMFLVFLAELREMPGWAPGAAVAVGVTAEAVVLGTGRGFVDRVGAERAIVISGAATVLRWLGCATTTSPLLLVALQLLHGLTFGLFLLAAMAILDREVPTEVRNSGQALFYVVVFGLGSAIGDAASGWIEDTYDAATAFGVAAAATGLATVVALYVATSVVGRLVDER